MAGFTFQWKDYRSKGREKSPVMTLEGDEFIRRFLIHVLPRGLQRIRFFGLLANRNRKVMLAECRRLLAPPMSDLLPNPDDYRTMRQPLTDAVLTAAKARWSAYSPSLRQGRRPIHHEIHVDNGSRRRCRSVSPRRGLSPVVINKLLGGIFFMPTCLAGTIHALRLSLLPCKLTKPRSKPRTAPFATSIGTKQNPLIIS
jgi:Putative transposase